MENSFWEEQTLIEVLYAQYTEPVCREYDLTKTELDILLFLANNPMFDSASEIVKHRRISKAHVSLSLRSLQERELVVAAYSPDNHRTLHLKLQPLATPIIEAGRAAQKQFYLAATAGFTARERERFENALDRIAENARGRVQKK